MKTKYLAPETEVIGWEVSNAILDMSMGGELAPMPDMMPEMVLEQGLLF